MSYGTSARRVAATMVAVAAAALLATACEPGGGSAGAASAPSAAATGAPSAAASAASAPTRGGAPAASASATAAGKGAEASGGAAAACTGTELKVSARQAAERPQGTGLGAAVVTVTNSSGHPCTVQGFPTVAGAGNGSPDKNVPLTVTHSGSAAPVKLAPGGKAYAKLTFVQVQGEADGYCVSGATPVAYPSVVLGLPGGAGSHQVGLADGLFAECDNKVTTTALLATSPA
ncbi:DUF4232 domain-containing protein [Kitasatospora camelliae]|uniref:DUF4232 domain-containing protein n=1 Tax=Kitasatospora camelliae TaxID=3156397 RepID=A0AAU8K416_9ACTN